MRSLGAAAVGALCLLMTSCGSSKPQELILGKWESANDPRPAETRMEFTADGVFTRVGIKTRRYRFIDDSTIELTEPESNRKEKYTVTVSKSELTLAGTGGDVETYKRVR